MTPWLLTLPLRPRRVLGAIAALSLAVALPACSARAQAVDAPPPPALVLVVRHAEKIDNSDDPALSPIGTARASALAEALSDARVAHVIVTQRQRTHLTAAPLMTARGLEPEVVPFGRDMAEHVRHVVAAARQQSGKVVLVVGHSNTVPLIVHALGGPRAPDLCDARYAGLFAVVPGAEGAPAAVVVSSFGVPDPPSARSCAGMVPR